MKNFINSIKEKAGIVGEKLSPFVPKFATKEGRAASKSRKRAIIGQAKVDRTNMLQKGGFGGYARNVNNDKILKKLNKLSK